MPSAQSTWGWSSRQRLVVGRSQSGKRRSSTGPSLPSRRLAPWPSVSRRGAPCCSISLSRGEKRAPLRDNQGAHMDRQRLRARVRWLARSLFAAGLVLFVCAPTLAADGVPTVAVLPVSGVVDQIMSGYIRDGLAKAQREGAA